MKKDLNRHFFSKKKNSKWPINISVFVIAISKENAN